MRSGASFHESWKAPQFRSAARLRDFLAYIVLETIEGRGENLKEYTIGTEVYRRPPRFNPKLDSIVRVEAVKLRARLDEYYAQWASFNRLLISVPKGGYIPEFRSHSGAADKGRSCAQQIAELCDLGSRLSFA